MKYKIAVALFSTTAALLILLRSDAGAGTKKPRILPGALLRNEGGALLQPLFVELPENLPKSFIVKTAHIAGKTSTPFNITRAPERITVFVPACKQGGYRLGVEILDNQGRMLFNASTLITPVRRWKLYMVPFTHIDIGFTQSQRKVLAQNLRNLDLELELIEKTKAYPRNSRFKLFTEVSWAVDEYLRSEKISPERKNRLRNAIAAGLIEPGAFYISHQNKFMPPEAVFASITPALAVCEASGTGLKTACIHDVFDFSGLVKPLSNAGVKYCMVGPNDSRYTVPPLFYLIPPLGGERILVWHTTGLNGYGENFDLKMRLNPPFKDADLAEMEFRIGRHLKALEEGYPTEELRACYDYYGAHWEYPYDAFLLPFYPTMGGDNQPQNISPCEIAREWNRRWLAPEMIVSTPSEFFGYVEGRYADRIPAVRGEMSGFWGEQIYLDLAQVDPRKQARQLEFERLSVNGGMALAERFLRRESSFDPAAIAWLGYRPLILNNDHNPRPVPFGKTAYDESDVDEWMLTRNRGIEIMTAAGKWIGAQSGLDEREARRGDEALEKTIAAETDDGYVLENRYYRLVVDSDTGGIKSLVDRELKRELVDAGAPYRLNQYLLAVRGESAGSRGYLQVKPGYRSVRVTIDRSDPGKPHLIIKGRCENSLQGCEILSRFARESFGISIPPFLLQFAYYFFERFYRPLELVQEISLDDHEKRVEFVQRFTGGMPQMAEHVFAYPLKLDSENSLAYDSIYSLLEFSPGCPLGAGDIIPAAKNIGPFPSINDSLAPFVWMYGMPPDFTFNTYVMARGKDYAVAFSSRESKLIIPGTLENDPEKKPSGGAFYHCAIGWTLWGILGLGAIIDGDRVFHSALTSFPARSLPEARERSFDFGRTSSGFIAPALVNVSPGRVRIAALRPAGGRALVMRLWETSGAGAEAKISFATQRKVSAVYLARSDGKARARIPSVANGFALSFGSGELKTVRVEF